MLEKESSTKPDLFNTGVDDVDPENTPRRSKQAATQYSQAKMATPTETDQSPRGGGFATSTPQILQPPGRFPAQSFSDTKVQDLQANFEHGRFNPSERQDNVVEPKSGKQPETRPISHDQLVIEVKGIYAGPMPLEAKCIEADMAHRLPSTAVLRLDTTHKRSYRLQRDPVPDSVKKVAVALSILISLQLSRFKGLAKLGLKPLSSALHYSQKLIGRYDDAVKTVSAPPNSVDRRISKVNSKDRDNIIPRASQKRTAKRYKPLCQLILRLCSGGNSGFCGVTACRWVILGCFWRLAACSPLPINNLTNNDFQGDRFKPNLWADSAVLFLSVIVLVTAQTLVTLKRSPVPIWSTLMAAYAFAWWSIRSDNSASLILNSG